MSTLRQSTTAIVSLTLAILAASNITLAQASTTNQAGAALSTEADDSIIDINTASSNNYKCELNESLVFYTHKDDDGRAALRWKNKVYGLTRVPTTTGADRFENKKEGLVWIGIPTKSMLFDSKRGQELADECVTASK